jgi:ABC-2 type transport system ATP-binding protein
LPVDRFTQVRQVDHELVVKIEERFSSTDLMRELVNQQIHVTSFNEILPSLNEIFITQVEGQSHE